MQLISHELIILQLVLILLAPEYIGWAPVIGEGIQKEIQDNFPPFPIVSEDSSIYTFIYSTHLLSARYGKQQENSNGHSQVPAS